MEINAYDYWGAPSTMVVTPYAKLCFTAFSIRKRSSDDIDSPRYNLSLPENIQDIIGGASR